eukprot:TRINITY_DN21709_c0_g1_i1.p1 TRINITY_DN21709_c0_g1~~TRINITY_DN21709_c0_g1_i1.p1  ORF type:complete len:608 (-),score=84.94 TRINITY_DN21709_c0_g1_i1:22-1845(-)
MSRLVAPTLSIPSLGLGGPPRPGHGGASGSLPVPPVPAKQARGLEDLRPDLLGPVVAGSPVSAPGGAAQAWAAGSPGAMSAPGVLASAGLRERPPSQLLANHGALPMTLTASPGPSAPSSPRSSKPFRPADLPLAPADTICMGAQKQGPGLSNALTAFGAPAEWWHDSIILGRLSALALRYFATKALKRPWKGWLQALQLGRRKRQALIRAQIQLALRSWHWRTLAHGRRLRKKMPLVRVLSRLPTVALAPAWARLRQAVFAQRDVDRRLKMLHLVRRKMLDTMAQVHYYQSLLRLGLAGLWLAAKLKLRLQPSPSPSMSTAEPSRAFNGHGQGKVQQVVCRAWRRWWFATRMWLSSEKYREAEMEAWLAGECSTPRSLVVAEALHASGAESLALVDESATTQTPLLGPARNAPGEYFRSALAVAVVGSESQVELPFPSLQAQDTQHGPLELDATTSEVQASMQRFRQRHHRADSGRATAEVFDVHGRALGGRKKNPYVPHLDLSRPEAALDSTEVAGHELPGRELERSRRSSGASTPEVAFVDPWATAAGPARLGGGTPGLHGPRALEPSAGSPIMPDPLAALDGGANYWAMRRSIRKPAAFASRR